MATKRISDVQKEARGARIKRLAGAAADALILITVLVFSAVAIVLLAIAAPLALAVSAMAGVFAPKHDRWGWRVAQAG